MGHEANLLRQESVVKPNLSILSPEFPNTFS